MAKQHTNDHFKFVKESIEERLYTYGIDRTWFSEEKLKQTLASVLCEDSKHYYQRHVQKLCELSSDKAVHLESLTQPDLQAVWKKVEELWPPSVYIPDFTKSTKAYIFCKPSLGAGTEPCVMAHITILKDLYQVTVESCDRDRNIKLLSLCLWVFFFYTKKKNDKKHKKTYNSTSHAFHSDLVICFIALQCRFPPVPEDTKIPVMPQFKNTIIHYGISPEHPAFQRLVLREMVKIIIPGCEFNNLLQQNAVAIAKFIYSCLLPGGFSWSSEGFDAILRIISDQSRYMALRQSRLQRNYVADKAQRVLSAAKIILDADDSFTTPMPALRDDTDKVLRDFHEIMKEAYSAASWEYGNTLPPLSDFKKDDMTMLNFLHHLILIGISTEIPGYCRPNVKENGWFEVADFIKEIRKLARTVVILAIKQRNNRKKVLYPVIARLAVALQLIIAARWYISEVEQHKKVPFEADRELINHQEVFFIFLAFRAIMMYILIKNSDVYRVQKVAKTLPSYAKELRLFLPLLLWKN